MKKKRKKDGFCILSAVELCFSLLQLPGFFGDLRRRKRPPLTPPEELEEQDAML
jgi:hypothetical protein